MNFCQPFVGSSNLDSHFFLILKFVTVCMEFAMLDQLGMDSVCVKKGTRDQGVTWVRMRVTSIPEYLNNTMCSVDRG